MKVAKVVKSGHKRKIDKSLTKKLLSVGVTQVEIAREFKVSRQAVNDLIKKHRDLKITLTEYEKIRTPLALAREFRANTISTKVADLIEERLANEPDKFSNKDLTELWGKGEVNAERAMKTERLLSGQSTSNVDVLIKALLPFREEGMTEAEFIENASEQATI